MIKRIVIGFLFALSPVWATAGTINVAVIQDNRNNADITEVLGQLNDSSVFDFNAVNVSQSNISTVNDLLAYDAIVLGGGGNTTAGWSLNTLQAAADFMTAGGGVVTAGWWHFSTQSLSGTAEALSEFISPALTSGSYGFQHSGTQVIIDDSHPITQGVMDFSVPGCCIEIPNGAEIGATVLGTTNGTANVIYQDDTGRSVYLGPVYMSNPGYNNDILRVGSADRLFEQAVAWAANGSATSVPAPAGVVLFGFGLLIAGLRRRA